MNGAHLHLLSNHLPIIIPIVGLLILLAGVFLKLEVLKRAAYSLIILGALSAVVASSTGEEAEEVVEKISGISEQYIEEHEEAAETFSALLYALGGISLLGFWASWKEKSFSKSIALVTIVFSFVVLFFAKQTGTTGGEIRHTEIRSDSTAPAQMLNEKSHEEEED